MCGMKLILIIYMVLNIIDGEHTLYDFSTPERSGQWKIINDVVMGGVSNSSIILNEDGTATFKGNVSLENNGGFASTRTRINTIEDIEFKGVIVRVKGDGKIYSVRFRTSERYDGYAYQAKIKTEKNEWKEFKIPFSEFEPTFRGYTLKNKPALESKDIAQMGLLIADKQSGSFHITLDWIKLYK